MKTPPTPSRFPTLTALGFSETQGAAPLGRRGWHCTLPPSVPPSPCRVGPGPSCLWVLSCPSGGVRRGPGQEAGSPRSSSGSAGISLCDHRRVSCSLWTSTDKTRGEVRGTTLSLPAGTCRGLPHWGAGCPPSALAGPRAESTQSCSQQTVTELALSPSLPF